MQRTGSWFRRCFGGGVGAFALPAAVLLAVVLGQRTSFGLFLSPMNTATAIGLGTLSLAVAAGQLATGLMQPVCGVLAGRYGVARVTAIGAALFALGNLAIVLAPSGAAFPVVVALAGVAGAAAGGAPMLMGAVGERVAPERRGLALGIVSAGGSAGQLTIAPLAQSAIAAAGWMNALLLMAALTLATMPLAAAFRARRPKGGPVPVSSPAGAGAAVRRAALRDRRYWLVVAGFFACGFHVSFLTTHMPGVIDACGMPAALAGAWLAIVGACNIAGSIVSGMLTQTRSMPHMLMTLYTARAVGVLLFVLAPKTPEVMLLFALWMGASYMATLPPTAGLLVRLYGPGNLATLLGLAMLFHQVGSFLGVWLGGAAFDATGHYDWIWALDIALALAAAAVHAPLRDAAPAPAALAAAGPALPMRHLGWR